MTIGEKIKILRINNNLSRVQLANILGYSEHYIKSLELNKREPTTIILEELEKVLNFDFKKFNEVLNRFTNEISFNTYNEIYEAISARDIDKLEKIYLSSFSADKDNTDEFSQLLLYCKAIVNSVKNKDFEEAKNNCIKGIKIDKKNFDVENIEFITTQLFSETSYSLLVSLTVQYILLGEIDKGKKITTALYNNFNNVILNNGIPINYYGTRIKKIYIVVINNLADICFNEYQFKESLELCNKGIALSHTFDTLNSLELLLKLKMENLYMLQRFNETKLAYIALYSICAIKENTNYLHNTNKVIKENYPLLIPEIKKL